MFFAVIKLEQRSFIQTLRAETTERDLPQVEQIDPEQLMFMAKVEKERDDDNNREQSNQEEIQIYAKGLYKKYKTIDFKGSKKQEYKMAEKVTDINFSIGKQ